MGIKKNYIVITSINYPTEAILKYAENKSNVVIVVADLKTPSDWEFENAKLISIEEQKKMSYSLIEFLPYNHYSRKMIGYLHAIKNNANIIIDTDDDNIPYENWKFPDFEDTFDYIADNKNFVNIYQIFTELKIWPRGLPLDFINHDFELQKDITKKKSDIGIWQGLADEDPDVDAIYRLTSNKTCYFNKHSPIVLGKGTISPFNSQNTCFRKEVFSLLYLPTTVSFRFTDILRSLVAQPIMWLYGYNLGFIDATVIQKRNPHDFFKDFISEIPMYVSSKKVFELVSKTISQSCTIEENLMAVYLALEKEKIVDKFEIRNVKNWISDLEMINTKNEYIFKSDKTN